MTLRPPDNVRPKPTSYGEKAKPSVFRVADISHRYFVLQINGQTASIHQCYEDAMREGLLLKNRFPHIDIKVCEMDSIEEVAEGTVFH